MNWMGEDVRQMLFVAGFYAAVVLVGGLLWIGVMAVSDAAGLIEPRPESMLPSVRTGTD
jgi:spore maturation protein SpmA